ncbi:Amino acid transporter AVT1D [Hondaea fermentalgiana]|uniref:Amino acid transporter AVT1D n=1 Tax=Hondaea fermentalgiana TaxID=2315210 RepID=A0A2R5GEZ8_9STRA|nr:Amino acid transporter AVT1D [Hondaea fermentalgiana]|eukprot:GBG29496.1 Amino acid transporter AVT1D [Hondaea fermentalgiana]
MDGDATPDDAWVRSPRSERDALSLYSQTLHQASPGLGVARRLHRSWTGDSRSESGLRDSFLGEPLERRESEFPSDNKSTVAQATFNGVNVLAGVGTLSLPFAFRQTGWALGLGFLLYLCAMTNFTGKLIGRCMSKDPNIHTYGDIGYAAFGKRGRSFITVIFCLELLAALSMFITLMGDNLHKLLGHGEKDVLYTICALIVLPTCWTSRLDLLSALSVLGILSTMLLLIAVVEVGFSTPRGLEQGGSFRDIHWAEFRAFEDLARFPYAIGLQTVGFAGHAVFPSIYDSLEDKSQFPRVINQTYLCATFIYAAMALLGYLLFTTHTQEELTLNLVDVRSSDIMVLLTVVGIIVNPFTKFALTLNPLTTITEQKLFAAGAEVPTWKRLVVRSILAIVALLLAVGLPSFASICAFVGAFCSMVVSLIFPVICFMRLFDVKGAHRVFLYGLNAVNITLCIVGTVASSLLLKPSALHYLYLNEARHGTAQRNTTQHDARHNRSSQMQLLSTPIKTHDTNAGAHVRRKEFKDHKNAKANFIPLFMSEWQKYAEGLATQRSDGDTRDEFLDEDLGAKRRAAEKLDIVAKALGPDRTRSELIPWMQDNLQQQEDEILYIFAKKSCELRELVGSADDAECMVPLVEALLGVEETFVREAASECGRQLVAGLKGSGPKGKVLESLLRLGKGEWFTSRMSACSLCGAMMKANLGADEQAQLKELYFSLCKDETPMVRRSAARELPSVIASLEPSEVVTEVMPIYQKLVTDPQESVSMNWIANIGELAARLGPELGEGHCLPLIKQYCTDRSWRIRYTVGQCFDKLCASFSPAVVSEVLLPLFCELLRDPEGEVRNVASEHLVTIGLAVSPDDFCAEVIPVMSGLVEMDIQRPVRLNISKAAVDDGLLKALGRARVSEHLLPMWEVFLKDANGVCAPEMRLVVLNNLAAIIETLGAETVASEWGTMLWNLFESSKLHNSGDGTGSGNMLAQGMGGMPTSEDIEYPHWRMRKAILNIIGNLASSAASDATVEKLVLDIWSASLADEVFEVRYSAACLLASFCESDSKVGPSTVTSVFIPRLVDFFKHAKTRYAHRIIFAHAVAQLGRFPGLAEPCYAHLDKCLDDKVPNVRLATLAALCDVMDPALKARISKKVSALAADPDADVAAEAKRCAVRL